MERYLKEISKQLKKNTEVYLRRNMARQEKQTCLGVKAVNTAPQ